MRRPRSLNVWPAYADLMTVLTVTALFAAAGLAQHSRPQLKVAQENRQLREQLAARQRQLDEGKEREAALKAEAVRNENMFRAIQEAQKRIDKISEQRDLVFSADQSLQFGDDLVSFDINSFEPKWGPHGKERLLQFCEKIRAEFSADPKQIFTIEVEGHTDSLSCPSSPHCNWWISSGRAASFVAVMREPQYCPGGSSWNLRPIGYADTKPLRGTPTRRIAVRLTPNYGKIISSPAPRR
ncbi:MAG TPA: hypothetical protein VHQ90_00570 [Thermoanaerobaculia bacterium]|nr:hypothetical protein [Thermoanaerobaculia bacterium]